MVKNVSRETKFIKNQVQLFLDVSSSRTGVIIYDKEKGDLLMDDINLKNIKKPPCMNQVDYEKIKMGLIKEYFDELKKEYEIKSVVMEGIFIQSKFLKSSTMLLKIHGFLMGYFIDTPQYFIPPTVIKKTITGKGNAKKDEVRICLERKYGVEFENEDISDAFALLVCFHNNELPKVKIKYRRKENNGLCN